MKRTYVLATLALLCLNISAISSAVFWATIGASGQIRYPQPPSGEYYNQWMNDYRAETDFLTYFSGSAFDFQGFFDHLYSKFTQELQTTVWGIGYQSRIVDYGHPSYQPGEAVGDLRAIATYVVNSEAGFRNALTVAPSGSIIFLEAGVYPVPSTIRPSSKTNLIVAGDGWNTILRLADGVNNPVLDFQDSTYIVVRDLTIDGNRFGNLGETNTYGLNARGSSNVLFENVRVVYVRRMGINTHGGNRAFYINNLVQDSGWNCMQHTRGSIGAAIGNYMTDMRDVGYSTWGSNNIVVANNVAVGPGIHDGLGSGSPGDGNWGIGVEPQGGTYSPMDSYNIIIRNNIASGHNVSGATEPWKGIGIWITGWDSEHNPDYPVGTYNIIIDRNVMSYNNRAGLVITADPYTYPELGNTIVVISNYASENDVYNLDGGNYGNYVIHRSGVVFQDNIEG